MNEGILLYILNAMEVHMKRLGIVQYSIYIISILVDDVACLNIIRAYHSTKVAQLIKMALESSDLKQYCSDSFEAEAMCILSSLHI
jgi:hypothetical protein